MIEEMKLIMAEQQFTGFIHASDGGDIVSLVSSMCLTLGEWEELKEAGSVEYMSEEFSHDIDQYFNT